MLYYGIIGLTIIYWTVLTLSMCAFMDIHGGIYHDS